MKTFIGDDYLLTSNTASILYRDYAKNLPIFDFHCHLSSQEIYEDRHFENIAQVWLESDHYKWRLLRQGGVSEEKITGSASDYDKFLAFASLMPRLAGNPIYEWSHLELARYFGVTEPLNEVTAPAIYQKSSEVLKTLSARKMIERSHVEALFTTNDPADDLHWHDLLRQDQSFATKVYPCFRPDRSLDIEKPDYRDYLSWLGQAANLEIHSFGDLKAALANRLDYFVKLGCSASDQSLGRLHYARGSESEAEAVFRKRMSDEPLSPHDLDVYKGRLLVFLGGEYKKRSIAQQYHIGAMRNNNSAAFASFGPDGGYDAMDDAPIAEKLSLLLDELTKTGSLPRTLIYALNPADYPAILALINCFQFEEGSLQLGPAWWFNDSYDGIKENLKAIADQGLLSESVGMLTDSRSFTSYARHEYFRRLFCDFLGELVEEGRYPLDIEALGKIVTDVSLNNAKRFFRQEKGNKEASK